MSRPVLFLSSFVLIAGASVADEPSGQLMQDPGFESVRVGPLRSTGKVLNGWEIQRTGRKVIQNQLKVKCVEGQAKSGKKCLSLSIPRQTRGFEFVTVGQRLRLEKGKEYEASVWARWTSGPGEAPKNAVPGSGMPSAIVSFWVRHKDGTGHFAGRDQWLFDNHWTRLSFRFRATDSKDPSLIYVSLLPNQKPVATTLLVDDFRLTEKPDKTETEKRKGQIVQGTDFRKQRKGKIAPPWYFANMGGTRIRGEVIGTGKERFFQMAMNQKTTNFESAQLWQHIHLSEGAIYEISCRMRWDNFSPMAPAPIINYGIYHEASNTWYGPVDQSLQKNRNWNSYRFTHIPPFSGKWKLYVQVNGWGNFGKGVTVSVDALSCIAIDP